MIPIVLSLASLPRSHSSAPRFHGLCLPRVEPRGPPGHHSLPQLRGVLYGWPRPQRRLLPGHRRAPPDAGRGDRDPTRQRRLRHGLRLPGQDGADGERQGHGPGVSVFLMTRPMWRGTVTSLKCSAHFLTDFLGHFN